MRMGIGVHTALSKMYVLVIVFRYDYIRTAKLIRSKSYSESDPHPDLISSSRSSSCQEHTRMYSVSYDNMIRYISLTCDERDSAI